jgi:uncharacterized protein YdbL (DUF1318 family)
MKKTFIILPITLILACSIKTPEITLTGEKTALENQILGAYDQLTDNNLITTSKRTSADQNAKSQNQVVRRALQTQQYNKDEVDELKRDHVVGENNKGYLEILEHDIYHHDAAFRKIVDALVEEENANRGTIYQRVLALNHKSSTGEDNAATIFAKMQFESSEPGTKIQQLNGLWIEKIVEPK